MVFVRVINPHSRETSSSLWESVTILHKVGEHESGLGFRSHLCAPWQCSEPAHMALKGGHLDNIFMDRDLMGHFTALLDYLGLGEFMSLAETQLAFLRYSTMEFWFCFQKHCRTMPLPTWCGSEVFKGNIMFPPTISLFWAKEFTILQSFLLWYFFQISS